MVTNMCGTESSDPAELTVMEPGPGDFELDCDVDADDYAHWPGCTTGPHGGPYPAVCEPFDVDFDGDVDLWDFGEFQCVFGGAPRRLPDLFFIAADCDGPPEETMDE